MENERMKSTPKWISPCGNYVGTTVAGEAASNVDLTPIVDQAKIARNDADQFKEEFAKRTFNSNIEQLNEKWRNTNYNWLPTKEEIPKNLAESVPEEHLTSLKLDEALLNSYEYLQKVAVGLEQVVWDQEDDQGPFASEFKKSECNLRALLCEILTAIIEQGLKTRPDVQRDIMKDADRHDQMTSKNLRAWIIYRDYMNILEYVIDVFSHLNENA